MASREASSAVVPRIPGQSAARRRAFEKGWRAFQRGEQPEKEIAALVAARAPPAPEPARERLADVVARLRAKREAGERPSPDELQKLYRLLGRPNAEEFARALRRRIGMLVTAADVKGITSLDSTRQVADAPPPKWDGKIFSLGIDDRWVADVAVFNSGPVRHALFVQDVFSRFVWARPMESQAAVLAPMLDIMRDRKPNILFTDADVAFTSGAFKQAMRELGVETALKVGRNDIATVDRAIGYIKGKIKSEQKVEGEEDWTKFLQEEVDAHNAKSKDYLFNRSPDEIEPGTEVEFFLQRKNQQFVEHNVKLLNSRTRRLEDRGFFRNYLGGQRQPGGRRRVGDARWSPQMHKVERIDNNLVFDEEGRSYPIKEVLPVSGASTELKAVAGLPRRRELQKERLRDLQEKLVNFLEQEDGQASFRKVGQFLRETDFFEEIVREGISKQNSLERFAALYPESFEIVKNRGQNLIRLKR